MNFIVRRLDPPHFEGSQTYWQTVAHRETLREAEKARDALKKFAKPGTKWWVGEEKEEPEPV